MKVLRKLTFSLLVITMVLFIIILMNIDNKYIDNKESENMISEENNLINKLEDKVVPYIVLAKINKDGNIFFGEVIEDKQNGETYLIEVNGTLNWYEKYYVTILDLNDLKLDYLLDSEIEEYINLNKFTSSTDYMLWVDIYRNQTYVLKKEKNIFKMLTRLNCSTGSIYTPTKRGIYEISNKGEEFLGRDKTYKCYYYMQYCGSYLLHSFPYDLNDNVKDDRINDRVSNGCVRYSLSDSKYLYDLIPLGTTIWLN